MFFDSIFGMFSRDLTIDLGTANTLVFLKSTGSVHLNGFPAFTNSRFCPSVKTRIIFQHFDSLYYCTQSCFTISKAPYPNSGSFIGSILYDPERMKRHHEYGLLVSFFNVGTVR